MALSKEVENDYKASLMDLNFNSKPLINMLTMVAEDHEQHAPAIVKVIEDHLNKCKTEEKLPALYLMDSIMKNLEKTSYRSLFARNLVQTFTSVFEQVDEKTRSSMFKLRQTWKPVLPNATLYRIDKKINSLLDPAWPINAKEPEQTSIHVNPRFLPGKSSESEHSSPEAFEEIADDSEDQEALMRRELIAKQQELLSLKQARLELELAETAEKLKKKQGTKGQSSIATSKASPLGLPLPSSEETLPVPEVAVKPRDPRPRPTDPRRRDPRLQKQEISSAQAFPTTGPNTVNASLPGYSAYQGTAHVIASSSQSAFLPGHAQAPYPGGKLSTGRVPPAGMTTYNGMPASGMPYPPALGIQPNVTGHFSGEVFAQEDCAKFSDENDSDSSRSSSQGRDICHFSKQSNIRDPRSRVEHKKHVTDPRVEHRHQHGNHRNNDKPVHKNSSDKHSSMNIDTHRETRDPRVSSSRSLQDKRKSKDRETHIPAKQSRGTTSQSPQKSGQQVSKSRSLSKERDNRTDSKLKDSFEADKKRKEEDRKKNETKRKSDEKRSDKTKDQTSREKSPQKSPKQYLSKGSSSAGDKKGDRKYDEGRDKKTESPKASSHSNNRKGPSKTGIKKDKSKSTDGKLLVKKSSSGESMDIDEKRKPGKEAEKRSSSDGSDYGRMIKKLKLEKPFTETHEALRETTSHNSDKISDVELVKDINLKTEDMDLDSESIDQDARLELANEPDVPKINDDISDLFGGEDEDYRPSVPKHQLPLKSPSSKGWDQFKASQPEHYAYDIELKKQRQDSVIETQQARLAEEPEDEDLRVQQPEFSRQMSEPEQVEIPKELSMNQHGEILLKANKQLKEGLITHDQYQELLKQLKQLMQIQQLQELQEQNRRLSGELLSPVDKVPSNDLRATASSLGQPESEMPISDTGREVRSPDRPLDNFKIPKKSRERVGEEDRRKELSNLYPESPQEDRYRGQGPFNGRENQIKVEPEELPPQGDILIKKEPNVDGSWREIERRQQRMDSDRKASPAYIGPDMEGSIQDRFDRGPGNDEFNRRGPVDDRRGPLDNRRGPPDDRRGPPDDRRGPPDDRRGPPDNRRGLPDDRRGLPDDRRGPPDDGRVPPDDRRGLPDDRRGPPDDRRGLPDDRRGQLGDRRDLPRNFPENRRGRNDGPHDEFDDRRQAELDYSRRGPPDRFEDAPGRDRRGPYRDDGDRRPDNWKEEQWPDRLGPDEQPDQRGPRFNGPGRELDRRGRDERLGYFEGPPDEMHFQDDGNRNLGDPGWQDERRPELWRDGDGDFDNRGFPGRFNEGRNVGPRGPNDIPPEMGCPAGGRGRHAIHRDRRGPHDDRRGGPQGDRRHIRDEEKNVNRSPGSWEDDMRGPHSHRGPQDGPYRRPGPEEGVEPWFPHERRGDSPSKEPRRGPHGKMHPNDRHLPKDKLPRHSHRDEMHEEEYDPAFPDKPKPLMSLLDPMPIRPPPGLRKHMGDPRMQGFGPRGQTRFDGPRPDGPPRFDGPRPDGPHRFDGPGMEGPQNIRPQGRLQPQSDSYIDKFGDARFRCFDEMGPIVSEEVIIGKRNFEIKLGAPPRKIPWNKDFIQVFADPAKRGIMIDDNLMYKFGERVKDVTIRGRKEKLFYHGRPINMWLDGQHYEVRVDAPPKNININAKIHKIQIDGRDMMILIDKEEKGRFGGEPRFVFIDEVRMEIRFDPPPRHILIDGNRCELKLNMAQPCVNIKGVDHGIRFDGPPRDVFINGKLYQIFTDHAVKLRVGNRYHYVALGGPCHEIIVDGKWFEMKFNEAPKEINVGNQVLMIQLPGSAPEVKILPEIAQEPRLIPPGMPVPMQPGMPGPGPIGFTRPRGPIGFGGPPGPNMPLPGIGPQGMPGPMPPPGGPIPPPLGPSMPPGMNIPQSSAPGMPISGAPNIPGIGLPVTGNHVPPSSVPNVLTNLFPPAVSTSSAPAAPIDINSLFAKLINTGIIKKDPETKAEPPAKTPKPEVVKPQEYIIPQKKKPEEKFEDVPDMTDMNTTEMKSLPVGMIQRLYSGVQCTSCGERFTLKDGEKEEKYRQHLDWHFRQNRKGKTDMKLTSCRKWYYGIDDWIQYEEVIDAEETGKSNFFEQQQQPLDATPTSSQNPLSLVVPEGVNVIRCPPATGNDSEDMCNICMEVFEQYWDEDLEEWHLRDAIKVGGKTYHPICYEDHTDVSEGTPSPSVLSVAEPSYMSRKSLTYDESSQDGHHASFEEERKISTDTQEPMDTRVNESVADSKDIKVEPENDSGVPVTIKQEPELREEQEQELIKETNVIKEEPDLKMEPVVKKEPELKELSNVQTDRLLDNANAAPEIKIEPVEVKVSESETDIPTQSNTEIKTDIETVKEEKVEQVEVQEKLVETPMEVTSSPAILDTVKTEESEINKVTEPVSLEADIVESSADNSSKFEQTEENTTADSEHESETNSQPTTNIEITTSGIYVNTSLSLPSNSTICETQHSPTYSKLSKIKLVIPQESPEINPEVLEIESNASTPTQDELPSPPGEYS